MELITVFNRCHRFRGFVYQHARFSPDHRSIEVAVRPRKGSAAICSRCHQPAPGYDELAERRFEFIPFWGFLVFLLYSMRRVDCRRCQSVFVEEVPWGDGKRTLTRAYMLFLARWARKLSWKETAEAFRTSWEKVFDAVEHVVTFGLEHRVLGQIDAIGVDEIQYAKGHKYLTLVYQIDLDVTRLLWVGRERTIESFQGFFTVVGDELASKIVFVCSDMWEPYLKVIREKRSDALHVLDRFHIVAKMNKALDEVRAGESRRIAGEGGVPVLKKSRWLLLKREENLKTEQRFRLCDLLRYNLKTVRAYLLKEAFQQLWDYNSPTWAGKFLDDWCRQVMRSRIEPMKKIARSLRDHRELILNYFRAQKLLSSGVVEGLNKQSQSHHEKILRLRYLPLFRTCSLSLTWQITRAGIDPRILLTNKKKWGPHCRCFEFATLSRIRWRAEDSERTGHHTLSPKFDKNSRRISAHLWRPGTDLNDNSAPGKRTEIPARSDCAWGVGVEGRQFGDLRSSDRVLIAVRFGEMMTNQGTMEKQNISAKPATPPIYRSQPSAPHAKPAPPPVYRPQPPASQAKLAAPPVYRPQPNAPRAKPGPPPVYRPQPPAPQAKLVAPPVYRPPGARRSIVLVKGAGTEKGCCLACARPGTAPRPFGNLAASHSIQQSKAARSSAPAPAKEEKKKWNGPSDKKAKKQAATKRHVVVVVADKAKEVESCESRVNFSAQFNTHVLNGELAGTSHSGYHSESATNFAAFGAGNVTGAADANGVYTADCTMNPGPGRVAKSSTFFPAGWDIATIRTEAAHAYCHQIAKGGIAGAAALAWVGTSTGGMMIGGTSGLPLNTAFPAYNGAFA